MPLPQCGSSFPGGAALLETTRAPSQTCALLHWKVCVPSVSSGGGGGSVGSRVKAEQGPSLCHKISSSTGVQEKIFLHNQCYCSLSWAVGTREGGRGEPRALRWSGWGAVGGLRQAAEACCSWASSSSDRGSSAVIVWTGVQR